MRVALNDIRAAAQCPAYYIYLKDAKRKPVSNMVRVAEAIIKRGYISAADTGFRIKWKSIITQVDREIFRDVVMSDKDHVDRARKVAEYILSFLRQWYHNIYLAENAIGFGDIEMTGSVGDHEIIATIPVIKLGDKPTIIRIDDIVHTETQLYNDIELRGLLWLASEALDCNPITAQQLTIKPQGGFESVIIKIDRDAHKRTKNVILQVLGLIKAGIDFPSVTEKCTICPFKRRCRL